MMDRLKTGHDARTDVPIHRQEILSNFKDFLSSAVAGTSGGKQSEYPDLNGIMGGILRDVTQNPERKEKYEKFLSGAFKLKQAWKPAGLPYVENRFRAFILIYFQQRLFDDIVDGDTPLKLTPSERVAYAKKRLGNLRTGTFDSADPIDAFALRILSDIGTLDPNYVPMAKQRLGQIMGSIIFDGKRICAADTLNENSQNAEASRTWKFSSRKALEANFAQLDIEGVTGLTLFLFGFKDSTDNMKLLTPLAQASRIAYNVRDFAKDIRAGLCNIPKEDADRLKITDADLREVLKSKHPAAFPQNVTNWLIEQVERGVKLLELHAKQPISSNLESTAGLDSAMPDLRRPLYRAFVANQVLQEGYIDEAEKIFRDATRELR